MSTSISIWVLSVKFYLVINLFSIPTEFNLRDFRISDRMGKKSKGKGKEEQEPAETHDKSTAGITEIPKVAEDQDPEVAKEAEEELTLLQKFFNKVSSIPPLRLILFSLTLLYLVKNYMSAPTNYTPPPLPSDHEQKLAEQHARDMEKYWMYGKYIFVSGALFLTMRIINERAESKLEVQRKAEQEGKPKTN